MIKTFAFIVKFDELIQNISGLLFEARGNELVSKYLVDMVDSMVTEQLSMVVNDLESGKFSQTKTRDNLNVAFQTIEILGKGYLNVFDCDPTYIFLCSVIDAWNDFVNEIGKR